MLVDVPVEELIVQPLQWVMNEHPGHTIDNLQLRKILPSDGGKFWGWIPLRREDLPALREAIKMTFGEEL